MDIYRSVLRASEVSHGKKRWMHNTVCCLHGQLTETESVKQLSSDKQGIYGQVRGARHRLP